MFEFWNEVEFLGKQGNAKMVLYNLKRGVGYSEK